MKEEFNFSSYDFLEPETECEPEEEIEEEGTFRERFQAFMKDRSFKALFKKWLIMFLILLYIVWASAQYIVSLTGDVQISFLPHRIAFNILSVNPTLALATAFLMALLAVIILFAFSKKEAEEEEAFKMAQTTTHGSAKFASDEDMRGAVCFHKLDSPRGMILGRKSNVTVEEKLDAVNILSDEAYYELDRELAACVDKGILQRNMNFAVFGPPGSGKSFSFVRPNVLARIMNGESYFVTDPSGEIYRDTAAVAEAHGFNVKVLNLSTPSSSNGWNPFDVLRSADPMEVQMLTTTLVHTILTNTADENAKGDVFFDQSEENLLKALILYVALSPHFVGEDHERHMGTVYDLLTKLAAQEGILEEFSPQRLPASDPAAAPWKMFQGAGRLRTNFITGLASRLEIFQVDIIKEMFSHSEINLSAAGQEKCAYYIVSSVTNNKMRFILSLFFSCAFEQLINDAVASGGTTKLPVFFILDEFKAIGRINGFSDTINNVRKYGLSIAMIFQDLGQLEKAYPNDANSIMSSCDTWIALGVNDVDTAKKLSERSGISTAETSRTSYKRMKLAPIDPVDPMMSMSVSEQKRNLLNPDEIMRYFDNAGTNDRKVLIFANNKNPYRLKAYGWPLHALAGEAIKSQREVSDYIPPWQKEEWTLNKKRTFLEADPTGSSELYGGKSLERDEFKERARAKKPEPAEKEAMKKPGGIVFNSDAKSTHLVELGLDLSGKKKV